MGELWLQLNTYWKHEEKWNKEANKGRKKEITKERRRELSRERTNKNK
jgi:hypothetical protein